MDPRRKKIYIILIITCFVLSAGILFYTYFLNTPSNNLPAGSPDFSNPGTSGLPTDTAAGNAQIGFTPPSVFPASDKFKTEVLDSTAFKNLKGYQQVNVDGQLGRPDPFRSY